MGEGGKRGRDGKKEEGREEEEMIGVRYYGYI